MWDNDSLSSSPGWRDNSDNSVTRDAAINSWRQTGNYNIQNNNAHYDHNHSNNNNHHKSYNRNPSLLLPPENSISEGLGEPPSESGSPTHLAPPTLYSRERRLSTSSVDSSVSHSSRRRQRRNSSTNRLSDFDGESDEVTLLSFARSTSALCSRIGNGFRGALKHLLVRSNPRRPAVVCEAEIMDQANSLCKDYIINKLNKRELMSRKVGLSPSHWPKSAHVVAACCALEALYPRTYSNLSRKLCLTMSSPKVVRLTLASFLEVLFERGITWGKVVSMFSVAGLFAEECSSQGHADYVKDVVAAVMDFTGNHLLEWLVAQGGWDSFPTHSEDEKGTLSKIRLLGLLGGTTAIMWTIAYSIDLW